MFKNSALVTRKYPEGNLLLRDLNREYAVIDRGQGIYLYDKRGKRYIDASGGALVTSVGHGNTEVIQRMRELTEPVSYVNGMQFTSSVAEQLAEKLAALSPLKGKTRALFLSSGSEATEAALKFVFQLWAERGNTKRKKILTRTPGYHGNTFMALSASARPHYKKFFAHYLHPVVQLNAPYEYRAPVTDYAKEGTKFYLDELKINIEREGAEDIGVFIFEPVIGSSAGASVPPPGYLEGVQKLCAQYEIPVIADEVMCGAGRTGKFFASEHFHFHPDLVTLGKGLNGGYAPLSAVLVREEHVGEMQKASGYFSHAQTYMHTPAMTAAGLAVLEYMEKHKILAHAEKVGKIFQTLLREKLLEHPHVGHVAGLGLMAGVEFVEDKKLKKAFPRAKKIAESLVQFAMDKGLILWPNVGHADGVNGDLVMLGPPLTIQELEVQELCEVLTRVIKEFFDGV